VKRTTRSDYRVVYFAVHGLVAGEVKDLAERGLLLQRFPQLLKHARVLDSARR
jgi:hypothetical protein